MRGYPSGLTGGDVRAMIASIAFTWATGTRVGAGFGKEYREFALQRSSVDERLVPVTPTGIFAARVLEAMELIAKASSAELLSEPTHDRGSIDPDEFLKRADRTYGGFFGASPPRYDLELSALRLPKEASAKWIDRCIRPMGSATRVKDIASRERGNRCHIRIHLLHAAAWQAGQEGSPK